jgi:acyl-CoA thioesterase
VRPLSGADGGFSVFSLSGGYGIMINILIPQEGRTGALENNLLGVMEKDNFAKSIGAIIKEARPGYAVAEIQISDMHKNGLGIVQGGVTYTLADFTFAAASYASGRCTIGVQSSITYFKPPKGEILRAVASEVSSSRRFCNYCVDVYDELGTHVARMSAMGYIKE